MWGIAFQKLDNYNTGVENRLDVLSGSRNPISLSESCECGIGTGMVEVSVNIPDDQSGEGVFSWNKIWKLHRIFQRSIINSTATVQESLCVNEESELPDKH